MGTPTNRTPVRVARGTYSNLNTNKADIQGSEIVYATDENKLYVKEGTDLVDANTVDISGKADVASPTFTGTPAAPTAAADTNTTQVATTAYVQTELGDYATLASPTLTGTPTVPGYAPLASPTLTGTPTVPGYATLASPTLTGTPASTTAAVSTNTTQIATTAFVVAEIADEVGSTVQAYDADTAKLDVDQTWTGAQRGTITALTDAATIAVDFDSSNNFSVTLGDNRTLGQPTNQTVGQSGSIFITQDGTGSRTLGYHADWKWAGGTAPTLSTTAAAVDRIDYIVAAANKIHAVATLAVA